MHSNAEIFNMLTQAPIDIHSHFNHGAVHDTTETEVYKCDLSFLESTYKNANVTAVGMSSFASVLSHENVIEENDYLHKLADEKSWVFQWVVVDPRQKETYLQAEKMLSHPKVLGIKIHPDCHGYNILDYADDIFSFADKHNAIMLMHPQHIAEMPKFADKYPRMKLIIAHLGDKEFVDAIALAKHGNIYTDTSGIASSKNNVIEYAVSRVGSSKILFGTDTYSFAFQFGRIALSSISDKDKKNILRDNAENLFRNSFK